MVFHSSGVLRLSTPRVSGSSWYSWEAKNRPDSIDIRNHNIVGLKLYPAKLLAVATSSDIDKFDKAFGSPQGIKWGEVASQILRESSSFPTMNRKRAEPLCLGGMKR